MPSPTFPGYPRPRGRAGVRNYLLVLPTTAAASPVAARIASLSPPATPLLHEHGENELREDAERTRTLLVGVCTNPNVAAVLVVGFGDDMLSARELAEEIQDTGGRPARWITVAQAGGAARAVSQGVALVEELRSRISQERTPVPVSDLCLGAKCGGSDYTSGLASNPALGQAVDRLIALGGSSVFCETPEIIGAEHLLARRASPEVASRLLACTARYEEAVARAGVDMRGGNPAPGNMAGGLTTLEEKSLGCVAKAGSTPLRGVMDYAAPVPGPGLYFMDSPGNDLESVTGLVAAGCQIVAFTTGRGTPTGHAAAPVLKLCANPETSRRMADNIDVDLSPVLSGEESLPEAGERILAAVFRVAAGELVKAEILGHREFSISRVAWTL